MDIILYAVPVFFSLILVELAVDRVRNTNYYRVNDSLTSLATGSINQLTNIALKLIPFTLYVLLYEQLALFSLGDAWWVWVVAFIAYDFFYYWNHRLGHEMNLLWAAHVVHHSSEEYNLTTALRQTGTGVLSFVFYLPMAILGIEPLIMLTVGAINLVYQFWVHTRFVPKLGWFDRVFVSPSNHRAHHAQNAVYIDRNYGGVFILWDRLFGSFQEELDHDPPIYGIRGALKSWNPIWANFQFYNQLLQDAIHTQHWHYKLTIWFRRTGWRPPDVVDKYPLVKTDLSNLEKYDTQAPGALKIHATVQYIVTTAIAIWFTIEAANLTLQDQSMVVVLVLLSGFSIGALLENKHYAGVLEWLRLGTLFCFTALGPMPSSLSFGICLAILASLPLLWVGRARAIAQVPAV